MRPTIFLAVVGLLATLPAAAEHSVLAEIDDLEPGDVEVRGFQLDRGQEVRVEARGLAGRDHEMLHMASAWILDAESREVVWKLEDARSVERRRDVRSYEDTVRLDAGTYEAYYATYPTYRSDHRDGWWENAARSMARMFGWDDDEDYERSVGDLGLVVRGDGREVDEDQLEDARERLREGAVLALAATDDDSTEVRGFELERPVELLIYAVGELQPGGGYDYGWILDAETREKVWTFTFEGSELAGGAKKNRVAYDTMTLPAGKYAAYFVTDGSHSPERWNALPPRDPAFWGLTLWAKDSQQLQYVRDHDYSHLPDDEQVIVEITRMRDGEHRTQGFTLSAPMEVRIYSLGEGREHGMDDYGWILDARSRRKVWTMDYAQTEHAGGGAKNRLVDETIRLEPGSYIVGFKTDGTHCYRHWNTGPPSYPERWGISVFGLGDFDRSKVSDYRVDDDPAVLARIARVRSGSHRRHDFSVDRKSEVSIYALGEGTHGKMYDYAWIEDSRGRVVWEMTYPMTGRAGGASKNRLYQGELDLEPDDYVLHYRTDNSHAFPDWNASPPDDPDAWGVQVALIQ